MDESKLPLLGDRFPDMEVKTTHGLKKLPEDYQGRWFVLFSHPGDFTPVCTTEFMAFQRMMKEFAAQNCDLIGLSVDQVFSHLKWTEWIEKERGIKIQFPIIADEQAAAARRLGMIHPGKGTNTVRAVFVVDPRGIVRLMLYYPQEVGRNMEEILRIVRALQAADRHQVALPANWPENQDLGNKVILPPAADVNTAEERLAGAARGDWECWDWWFCFQPGPS